MRKFLLVLVLLFCSSGLAKGSVVINEVSPRSDPEWVELYNSGPDAVDLTGWYLLDLKDNQESLSSLGLVQANHYIVFSRPKGWLNDTSEESLRLYSPGAIDSVDSLSYITISENMSVARIPNITGAWFTNQIQTQGISNDISVSPSPSSIVSPSPSSIPPAAQTPTPSPSPTLSPSPTPSPSPSPTPKPSIKPTPSPLPTPDLSPAPVGTVAGESIEIDLSAYGHESPVPSLPGDSRKAMVINPSRAKTALLIGTSLVLISLASYFGYRKYLDTIVK